MKLILYRFQSNNKELKLSDVVDNFQYSKHESGIINIAFNTKDKYIDVNADQWTSNHKYKGCSITLMPFIGDLIGEDIFEQDDWWIAEFILDGISDYINIVTPLKHNYIITYIPDNIVLETEMQQLELIEDLII